MTLRLKLFTACAAVHLFLCALSAAHFNEWGLFNRQTTDPLYYWGEFTGSSNIYSFFAPFVGEQISVLYTLADTTGRQRPWMLEGNTREATTRFTTVYNFLNMPESQRILCSSFGNNALRLCPDASMVRLTVIQQTMPDLQTARQTGAVPCWKPLYAHTYQRK